ncbi:MAG: glycosyltransferase family 39 protein, partial [Chloroflexota bacterium]
VAANHPYGLLLVILLISAFFRFHSLGYSEFTADEIKPLVLAAESLEGDEESIFVNRKKGPGEIMIPMMLWRLTGTIDEATARTPFALAGVLAVLALYLTAARFMAQKAALIAAALLALNGFMVGFARILQYQTAVIWLSLLALWCIWQWRQTDRFRWLALTAIFLGVGVLFHYDALLVAPVLAYVVVSKSPFDRRAAAALTGAAVIGGGIIVLFWLPFAVYPQVLDTANYVGERIGGGLIKNNLFDFFHYTIFYDSFYYILFTGVLLLGFLGWAITTIAASRPKWLVYGAILILMGGILYLSIVPKGLYISGLNLDLAFLPFAVILVAAWLSPRLEVGYKIGLVWLAVTFLGYNFVVDDPRTHFYSVSPAWVMLAAPAALWLWRRLAAVRPGLPPAVAVVLAMLLGGYLYIAFLRQDIEFREDWPAGRLALYWSPYTNRPRHRFGFVHKVGWKAVGGLYATGQLAGRFNTNSESGLYDWYARSPQWGCACCNPKPYYFAFNYKDIPEEALAGYDEIGYIELPVNHRGVTIYQTPSAAPLDPPAVDILYRAFDQSATPAAFVWPRGQSYPAQANLANLFTLTGYNLTMPRPYPGEELALTLYWQRAQNYQPVNFDVFVYMQDAAGAIWGQSAAPPVCGQKLTTTWSEAETVADSHIITIDPNTPPGTYTLFAGMVVAGEDFRLPVFDQAGQTMGEAAQLGTVTIE